MNEQSLSVEETQSVSNNQLCFSFTWIVTMTEYKGNNERQKYFHVKGDFEELSAKVSTRILSFYWSSYQQETSTMGTIAGIVNKEGNIN